MKKYFLSLAAVALSAAAIVPCFASQDATPTKEYVCIAYAWEADGPLPPADMVTAVNYLGACPNATSDGVDLHNPQRLKQIVALKKENPDLKVILSLGGADAGGWTEMAADSLRRKAFVADCMKIVDEYGLDGIDYDWEFPSCAAEEADYVSLFKDTREALGNDKVLSAAAGFFGNGFPFKQAMDYLDYVNMMTYDMGWQAPYHHTALRRSPLAGVSTIEESLDRFVANGIDVSDLVLGLAFYGRGEGKNFKSWTDYKDIAVGPGMEERWDSVACVPYIVDANGELIVGFDNPESLKIKCDFIKAKGLRGAMYWRTELDTDDHQLTRTVARELLGR